MRKFGAWGLAAALVLGLAALRGWAGDDDEDHPEVKLPPRPFIRWSPWAIKMFHIDETPAPVKKPDPKPKKTASAASKAPQTVKPTPVVNDAAGDRAREEAALMRRLEVCDKLKEIAIRTNDAELLRKAEVLDERARTTYAQRTAYLRGTTASFESDEKTLDKYLAATAPATSRLMDSTGRTAANTDLASQAATKEVNR
jgi:hypothetical protein